MRGRVSTGIWGCLRDLGSLTDDGQRRAAGLRDVLAEAFAEQGRWPLRRWVERVWMKLGGPACLRKTTWARYGMPWPTSIFSKAHSRARMCAISTASANASQIYTPSPRTRRKPGLHVMTIHKAKGLEFDSL